MIQFPPTTDPFGRQLLDSFKRESKDCRTLKIAKHANIYTCGDKGEHIYVIERGQVKLLMITPGGKECLLAIHSAGDVFGELILSGLNERLETAIAMETSLLKMVPVSKFISRLAHDSLFEAFIRYLVARIADQQEKITNLATANSEIRLGKVLLQLARKLGRKDLRSIVIEYKITHEELSEMVGTTRPRISEFMRKFRDRNLIEITKERFIKIKEKSLNQFLNQKT